MNEPMIDAGEFFNQSPEFGMSAEGWIKKFTGKYGELKFQSWVNQKAKDHGWRYYHPYRSEKSVPGFPDLTAVRGDRIIFAELKTEKGKLSNYQNEWLQDLRKLPLVEVYLWRPSNWKTIEEVLR